MAAHTDLGAYGEYLVARTLSEAGPVQPGQRADLRFRDVEIEVKSARPRPYSSDKPDRLGYQFCLEREGHTRIKAPVVVLLCFSSDLTQTTPFVIPAAEIGQRRKIVIPNDAHQYAGMWSPWRDRWDVIAEHAN